ncbi:ATP synthase regulation protein NCA2-domain-containing protein [Tricharina praecox]|uniref:ATP synthase regulation protein NCA2-domain-containing protein n=1 Tax=Tricharina praecox TaxID=43433 RepID=UPI0022204497|nr:ATP synthase regulation protein NCA2-domain-containing protein [Tricharina praecox]KAI5848137.1 ATP synthase regulation protein NCA2-domain-containing protein [Tricharina praecox]
MTFASAQIRRLDASLEKLQLTQLERIPITEPPSATDSHRSFAAESVTAHHDRQRQFVPSEHAQTLQRVIRQLGSAVDGNQSSQKLMALLKEANITNAAAGFNAAEAGEHRTYERELEWLLLSRAAIQTYGIVLNSLVDQTLPLSQDLFYWDEVLSSYRYTALYCLQTSPHRLLAFSKEVLAESRRRLKELQEMERPQFMRPGSPLSPRNEPRQQEEQPRKSEPLSETARKFYGLVKNTLHDRVTLHRFTAMSPFSLARHEIREKQASIRKLREMQASALGLLIGEGLSFEFDGDHDEWRGIIERAVSLMENVVRNVSLVEAQSLNEFEESVFDFHSEEGEENTHGSSGSLQIKTNNPPNKATAALCAHLQDILVQHLPAQATASREIMSTHGRPSKLTRYWLPATALLLSSTTILRILVNRQEEIKTWIMELGTTIIDFWANWVVEPTRKVIGTIRHSEDSEVALMSRKSLAADMESLERMVVDFAIDNPNGTGSLSTQEIELVRANVKEGDLTPVLKAYEHDLRKPFQGAIKGELVRALLIQIQKTKVDVEVAITGIDRLLKSQELVFGFVGLTPGLFISVVTARWIAGMFRGKQQKGGHQRAQIVRRLRNVDRILTGSGAIRGQNEGCLNYKEHGLLLCEVHVLMEDARMVLNRTLLGDFVADLEELVDVRGGVKKQLKVVERIRWAYARWLK